MRRLNEVEFDIETVTREMSRCVIAQSDMDSQLARLDRRRAFLEKERLLILEKQGKK